jgi:anti-sigma28 factor (negative regulator of flagellin synthesis)
MVDRVGHVQQATEAYRAQNHRAGEATPVRPDQVEISQAGRAAALRQAVAQAVAHAPEIRQERVKEARERLERGEYLTQKVIERVAEKIADSIVGTSK